MRLRLIAGITVLLALALAAPAEARHVRFAGPHPIAARSGGGYCYIDVPHLHLYAPDHAALYSDGEEGLVFTGDPTPFGYEGPRYAFYGHHPLVDAPGVPCFLDGPHYHALPAPESADWPRRGEVSFYVGAFPPSYYRERPHRERAIAVEYRPYVALRPTVEVTPPSEWRGEVWVAPPVVQVGVPTVRVSAPPIIAVRPPTITVEAPPPIAVAPPFGRVEVRGPRFGVVVGAPPPLPFAPAPGTVYLHERRGDEGDEDHGRGHGHHDHGRHEGWYKHGEDR